MPLASVVAVVSDPNNPSRRYNLWGNGRIDPQGGAVPITDGPSWYDRLDQPVAQDLHILDWDTGEGYLLDFAGGVHALNGADTILSQSGDTWVNSNGLPYTGQRTYHGWSWDPSGSGQGYAVTLYGELVPFGGALPAPRTGPRFATPAVKGFAMRWTPDKRAYMVDLHGAVWLDFAAVLPSPLPPYFARVDVARDLAIADWATGSGYVLTADGAAHVFGSAVPPGYGAPYRAGSDVARALVVLSASNPTRLLEVWYAGQEHEWVVSTPPTVVAGAGVNEQQLITITGAPTGGTFTVTFAGQTTASIPRNATALQLQSALEALSTIGVGNVAVAGGPGPGTPWTVTFTGALAATNVAQMTATSSLTGGSSPAVTITTPTPGVATSPAPTVTDTTRPVLAWSYFDPQGDSQAAWRLYVFTEAFAASHDMSDPSVWADDALVNESGINPAIRGIPCPIDLTNGSFRQYTQAQDTAGQWSEWDEHRWTQDVPIPATPTGLTAVADNATMSTALSVAATAGSADFVLFEASDDEEATWQPVVGAEAVALAALTTATDRFPPFGVDRVYRATAYSDGPAVASAPSTTATATVTEFVYAVHAVDNPTLGGQVPAVDPSDWSRPVSAEVIETLGDPFPTVVKDGAPVKARRLNLNLITHNRAEWLLVKALGESKSTLVYRDPFGEVVFCEIAGGDWPRGQLPAAALLGEATPLRHMHSTRLPLVEVRPPTLRTR